MHHATELLMPAGSLEKLKVAILYGADAVYMGTPDLSLRTRSNLTLEEVLEGVAFARAHGKRAYLTLNLVAHNRDIEKLGGVCRDHPQGWPRRRDRGQPTPACFIS